MLRDKHSDPGLPVNLPNNESSKDHFLQPFMSSNSALHAQFMKFKGKENVLNLLLKKSISNQTVQNQGRLRFRFLLQMSTSILFFFAAEAVKDRELNHQKFVLNSSKKRRQFYQLLKNSFTDSNFRLLLA